MANGLQIRTTKDYANFIDITLRIPKEVIIPVDKKAVRKTKEFTEDDALKIAERGTKEYYAGKLQTIESLDELLP